MKEDFLHYLWKFKKFNFLDIVTTSNEPLQILSVGLHNTDTGGPDFFNAQLKINNQLWAGNVEIHLKASDWYAHAHEEDANYDNVILHVVWEADVEVFRKDETIIPTLVLKDYCNPRLLYNYQQLFEAPQKWINCEQDFHTFTDFQLNNWLERLYIERLEEKSVLIFELLKNTENNWEAVLFQLLAKNFGLNKNGAAFLEMATVTPIGMVRKINDVQQLEALFFGQCNMLEEEREDSYFIQLQKEYTFLKHKFGLVSIQQNPVHFFRLRPPNFPTIRLSQLAQIYFKYPQLFNLLVKASTVKEIQSILKVATSEYWESHFSFGKESKKSKKPLTPSFINLLIINTIVPLKFAYQKQMGKGDAESLINLLISLDAEENSVVKKFNQLRKNTAINAFNSQALLQLKPNYCDKNKCLQCELGASLLQSTST
jgi:hypothetical protein